MKVWDVNVSRVPFDQLLKWCLDMHKVNRLLVSVRMHESSYTKKWRPVISNRHIHDMFGKYIIEEFLASAWPGTELIGHPGKVYVSKFSNTVAKILFKTEPALGQWLHNHKPPLPEDICLFRLNDKFPLLITATHEQDGWLITDKVPRIPGVKRSKDYKSQEGLKEFVFSGKYFCRLWKK